MTDAAATYQVACTCGGTEVSTLIDADVSVDPAVERRQVVERSAEVFDFLVGAGEWSDVRVVRKMDLDAN